MKSKSAQSTIDKANRQKLMWGLICLIGPTALIIVAFLAYALLNFILSAFEPSTVAPAISCDTSAINGVCVPPEESHEPILKRIANIVLFTVGAFSVITWLPGIIVGIILLTSRKT